MYTRHVYVFADIVKIKTLNIVEIIKVKLNRVIYIHIIAFLCFDTDISCLSNPLAYLQITALFIIHIQRHD